MGGGMAVPETDEAYHSQMDIAESLVDPQTHEKCMHASGALMIWAGITDHYEEDLWVNPYTMEQTALTFWEPGRPNGGTTNNCARTYLGFFKVLILERLIVYYRKKNAGQKLF